MRVGIDYRPAWAHAPGVGRYARELVRALVRLPAPPELALFEWGDPRRALAEERLGIAGAHAVAKRMRGPVPRRATRILGALGLGVDRLLGGVDWFHHVGPQPLPVRRARESLAVSELPSRGSDALERRAQALRAMDAVLVFSQHAAERVTAECGVDAARVHATPVGCDHWRRDLADSGAQVARRGPEDPVRLVALGALAHRRRPLLVLDALERLAAGGVDASLAWIGRAGDATEEWERRRAASADLTARAERVEPHEDALPALVAGADLLVHLADEELTPVTPLEACALGPAVVAERLPALEEALGDRAVWVPRAPEDPAALADALARGLALAEDDAARRDREALAEAYSWRGCALATQRAWLRATGVGSGTKPERHPTSG